jgi:hypothetical protein
METDAAQDSTYRLKSARSGSLAVPPCLTIVIADREAKIHTTLGEVVTVSRAEFMSLVRRILRENDRDVESVPQSVRRAIGETG